MPWKPSLFSSDISEISYTDLVRGLNQIIAQIVPQAPFLDQGEI